MSAKVALITGVTGQDGSYLAEQLLALGYRVAGVTRDPSATHVYAAPGVEMHQWDLRDETALRDLIARTQPAEIYNFAAFSSGSTLFDEAVNVGDINGLAVTRILEAIREVKPDVRFCQASSSEMFGDHDGSPLNERSPMRPRNPYAAAKFYAHTLVDIYRTRHRLFACSAIFFNHESPRRGRGFVTRRVSEGAARIRLGLAATLELGDLEARRDWGFSRDYVDGARLMLQQDTPDDYVFATGETHSVRELCERAFAHVGLDYRDHVRADPAALRQHATKAMVGDAGHARDRLKWRPSIGFHALIEQMVDADLQRLHGQGPQKEKT